MQKKYYILFGSKARNIDDIAKEFTQRIDIEFQNRTSFYKGDYLIYSGLYADILTIEKNFISDDWKECTFKGYQTLIYLSFTKGKTKDRKNRANHIKKGIINNFLEVDYLRERIVDDDGQLIEEIANDTVKEINKNARKNFT